MSDKFERELREHLHKEAAQTPQFPRALRSRIADGVAPHTRSRMAPQLALAGALVLVAVVALGLRNSTVVINTVHSAIQVVLPTPSPSPTPSLPAFGCTPVSGGKTGLSTGLSTIQAARHDGYDRIVFHFASGIPSYDVVGQDSPTFVRDASGQQVTLDGSAGVKAILRLTDAPGTTQDAQPKLPAVRQITQIGNFKHQLTYGFGLASSTCFRAFELSNPPRLVIDFDTSKPSAAPSLAPTPQPTLPPSPASSPLSAFTCTDLSGGTPTAPPAQLTDLAAAHHPGYDRIVFQFAGGQLPAYTLTRQASTHFNKDASGQPVTLQGSSGLKLVFHGAAAYPTYAKSSDLKPGLPVVQEVEQIGDFEGVLSWGIGLSQPSCVRAFPLSLPTRLVIDVQTP
ncbi:MAG: hypothetical protein M3Z13_02920 [Candidatus Dormibacteraeota bacterium]|nr:hypothetical protein [Candidatus Dormibacteraeota bacterium]